MSQPGNPRSKFGAVLPTPDEFEAENQKVPQSNTVQRVAVESDDSDSDDDMLPDFITNRPSLQTFEKIFGDSDSEDEVIDLEKSSAEPEFSLPSHLQGKAEKLKQSEPIEVEKYEKIQSSSITNSKIPRPTTNMVDSILSKMYSQLGQRANANAERLKNPVVRKPLFNEETILHSKKKDVYIDLTTKEPVDASKKKKEKKAKK